MKYPRILAALRSAKWAILPSTLQAISDTLSARMTGRMVAMDDMDNEDEESGPESYIMVAPGVAAVNLHGIIGRNLSSMEMLCGGCDIARVEDNLAVALASPEVAAVVLNIESPGGVVSGVPEFTERIRELQQEAGKPVVAWIGNMGCSAAYWIACGCQMIGCSRSSDVGSIGVYMAAVDESEAWAREGFKLVLISSGKNKAAGMPGSKITDEQMAIWQADVDYIFGEFRAAVESARSNVSADAWDGRVFMGPKALAAGLVDEIAPDLATFAAQLAPVARMIG